MRPSAEEWVRYRVAHYGFEDALTAAKRLELAALGQIGSARAADDHLAEALARKEAQLTHDARLKIEREFRAFRRQGPGPQETEAK